MDRVERAERALTKTWGEQWVDATIDRAWLELRVRLAEQFADILAVGETDWIELGAPTGEVVVVALTDGRIDLAVGDDVRSFDGVDEAAHAVQVLLRDDWQVVHPSFVSHGDDDEGVADPVLPVLRQADSADELQAWVEAAFAAVVAEPLRVRPDGEIGWRRPSGARATVSVRNERWVEVWTVLATEVAFTRARAVVEKLSSRHVGVAFSLQQDRIVMSRLVDAGPFVPDHLRDAVELHLDLAEKLAWVSTAVLRKRASRPADAVPPALLALLPSVEHLPVAGLADLLVERAGSRKTLRRWHRTARREWQRARDLPRGADDPLGVHRRQRTAWKRLVRATSRALD